MEDINLKKMPLNLERFLHGNEQETPASDAKETPEPLERNEMANDDQDRAGGGESDRESERSSLSDSLG